jgi:hypothetical protein
MASGAHPTPDGARKYPQEIMNVLDNVVLSNLLMNISTDTERICVK